jgi:biotin operon repressor
MIREQLPMLYKQSHDIEKRLNDLVRLIRRERHSSFTLAVALHVSRPTVARGITALRERGYQIRAIKDADGWAYKLVSEPAGVPNGTGLPHK